MVIRGPLTLTTLISTGDISRMLGVTPKTVIHWITLGALRTAKTPAGHRRILTSDFLDMLRARAWPIPEKLRHLVRPAVLIVDDEPAELRAMKRLLKPFSDRIDVYTAGDGINALIMLGELRPALVVIDVIMRGIDGVEVCRRIRARPSLNGTKVVVVSADMREEIVMKTLAAGAERAWQKPVKLADLLDLVGIGLEVKPVEPSPRL